MYNFLYNNLFLFLYFFLFSLELLGSYLLDSSLYQFAGSCCYPHFLPDFSPFYCIFIGCFENSGIFDLIYFYFQLCLTSCQQVLIPCFLFLPLYGYSGCVNYIETVVSNKCVILYVLILFYCTAFLWL